MSEAAKVRIVRCPKCETLLPEVTDYSIYQCGGCGAVLRAKSTGVDMDTFSEKSDEERNGGGTLEKLKYEKRIVSEKRMEDRSDGSETDTRSNISSSSQAERRRVVENNSSTLTDNGEKWDADAGLIQEKVSEAKIARDLEDLVIGYENLLHRPGRVVGGIKVEKSGMEGFRACRVDAEVASTKQGSANLPYRSSFDCENPVRNRIDVDGLNYVNYAGDDKAELFRKLDELKDQLSRSGNLFDKGKEKVPLGRKMANQDPYASEDWYPDVPLEMNRTKRPPYQNQYSDPPPFMHGPGMGANGYHPPRNGPSYVPGYGDPFRPHMLRRGPHQPSAPYQLSAPHAYRTGPYMDDAMVYMDATEPYPPNFSRHHPSCSCYHCCDRRQVPYTVLDGRNDKKFSYHDNPGSFGSRDYNNRISNPSHLRSHSSQSHTRWPSDVTSEADGFIRQRPPRVHIDSGLQTCRPVAGGAPFFTCYNCFELVILPKKVLTKNSKRKQMRCGACSSMIVFAVSEKKLVISVDEEARDIPRDVGNSHDGYLSRTRTTFLSEDYDNSCCDLESVDRDSGALSRSHKPSEMENYHFTSVHTSEAEEDGESLAAAKTETKSADPTAKDKMPPPPAGSSLQDHFEYSNVYRKLDRKEKVSTLPKHDDVLPNKTNTRRKESSATEIDISSNEYSNMGTTFGSGESSGDRAKGSRAESFFAGLVKHGFKDSNRFDEEEQEKANVTVNGHLIPDRLIKKAEKLAGPIHSGHYWYDFRAGFWGAIGGPCLGIVPPFIEEFNYPMPDHCAGGDTNVFVNGRELNQKDLNLLIKRGLPTDRDRSYIIEISGRVLDEDTGEELESLGKLAPTVEKMKHGFGMKAPKPVA